jgi:hypothetical protein
LPIVCWREGREQRQLATGPSRNSLSAATTVSKQDNVCTCSICKHAESYSFYRFVDFLADVNPDDGSGIIKEVCSSENNFKQKI